MLVKWLLIFAILVYAFIGFVVTMATLNEPNFLFILFWPIVLVAWIVFLFVNLAVKIGSWMYEKINNY